MLNGWDDFAGRSLGLSRCKLLDWTEEKRDSSASVNSSVMPESGCLLLYSFLHLFSLLMSVGLVRSLMKWCNT